MILSRTKLRALEN